MGENIFTEWANSGTDDPSSKTYRWGINKKVVKGVNTDTTYGVKNSNTVGLYFSTVGNPVLAAGAIAVAVVLNAGAALLGKPGSYSYFTTLLPGKFEILYSDKWDVQFFTNNKFVLGTDNKNTGGEWGSCRGHKYETYYGDLYKYIYGKEHKIEAKGKSEIKAYINLMSTYASDWKAYSAYDTRLKATNDNEQTAGRDLVLDAGRDVTGMSTRHIALIASQNAQLGAVNNLVLNAGATAKLTGGTELEAGITGAGMKVTAGKVTLGPMVDIGIPSPITGQVQVVVNDLAAQLAAAQAEANAAKLEAQAAMEMANLTADVVLLL